MQRRAKRYMIHMILVAMGWALFVVAPGQARPLGRDPASSPMERFLKQQIALERESHAARRTATKKPQQTKPKAAQVKKLTAKLAVPSAVQRPLYRVLLISGWRKKLQADLVAPNRDVIRVKVGDRLTAHLPHALIVKAITEKNVKLARGSKIFLLPMALDKDIKRRMPVSATR